MKSGAALRRASFGARSLIGTLLALVAAVLAVVVADWKYVRFDLSTTGRNTLDEEIVDLIAQLPEPVRCDFFYRVLERPYSGVSSEAIDRTREVLGVAMETHRDLFEVREYDVSRDYAAAKQRQQELGVEGVDFVVFTNASGTRKSRAELYGDLVVVDWGVPEYSDFQYLQEQGIVDISGVAMRPEQYRPARVGTFLTEEVLAKSLLKVSSPESPRVYFATGQGEPPLEGSDPAQFGELKRVLEEDDFEVSSWNPAETPDVPEDCVVLGLVGSTQPFPPGTLDTIREWVRTGGRLFAAPALESIEAGTQGGIEELLMGYGMIAQPGIVCVPLVARDGQEFDGDLNCARIAITDAGLSASSPLTEPLRRRSRRLDFFYASSFRRGAFPGGILLDVVVTSPSAWRDLSLPPNGYDFHRDRGEERGRQSLVLYLELPSGKPLPSGEVEKGRVLGIGNSNFLWNELMGTNKDFVRNAFNYLDEDRNYRIRVSPLPRPEVRLDLARSDALPKLTWLLYLGLPGLAVSMGLFLAWRRRSR